MRWLIGATLVIAMLAFGIGVYHAAGYLKGERPVVQRPTQITAPPLPGTMYVVQNGELRNWSTTTDAPATKQLDVVGHAVDVKLVD